MKKLIFTAVIISSGLSGSAQMSNLGGVPIVEATYGIRLSSNGEWIAGPSDDGGTVCCNWKTGEAKYYAYGDYGRGNVVSNNGWVVGCQMIDDEATRAIVMFNGLVTTPSCFDRNVSGNIHGITPDGSRICGVVGSQGTGYTYLPYYCDIDAGGNFGELQYLPFTDKDFFGMRPQYCSATWISEDGKTILGQVIDSRGIFIYPIVYKQQSNGEWKYFLPSESLFNMADLPLPKPLGDIDDEYPDAPYPDIEKFMTTAEYVKFQAAIEEWNRHGFDEAYDPYSHLDQYMSAEKYAEYVNAVKAYNQAVEEYNELNIKYWDRLYEIADNSIFFVRNAMALSLDGQWIASTAQIEDMSDPLNPAAYYVPYVCNLNTGEWVKIESREPSLITNQVLPGGKVICTVPMGELTPPSSYIYFSEEKKLVSIFDYMASEAPQYAEWYLNYTTNNIIVGEEDNGDYIYAPDVTVTGHVSFSEDMSVMTAGVDGYMLDYNNYFTYIFTDLPAGIEEITATTPTDGFYTVYNLQGVRVLRTKDSKEINNLSKGIYVVNGKKIMIK